MIYSQKLEESAGSFISATTVQPLKALLCWPECRRTHGRQQREPNRRLSPNGINEQQMSGKSLRLGFFV